MMNENANNKKLTIRQRSRNWTCIIYPDSLPNNWRDIIIDLHVQIVVSPLHDKDLNADKTPKKPHYHLLIKFETLKSQRQVFEMLEPLNGTIPIICDSVNGLVRYFAHLDNPEKAQYNVKDIECFAGADIVEMLKKTASDKHKLLLEMAKYIRDNNVTEYIDFFIYCAEEHPNDWYVLLCDNCSLVVSNLINSQRNKFKSRMLVKAYDEGTDKDYEYGKFLMSKNKT